MRERVQVSGTGPITLGGAVSGYDTFATGLRTFDQVEYTVRQVGSDVWERRFGTFDETLNVLTRDRVYATSAGGTTAVSFSGLCDVYQTLDGAEVDPEPTADDAASEVSLNSPQFGAVADNPAYDNAAAISAWLLYASARGLCATGSGTFYVSTVDAVLLGSIYINGRSRLTFIGLAGFAGSVITIEGGASRYSMRMVGVAFNSSLRTFVEAAASGTCLSIKNMDGYHISDSRFIAGAGYLDAVGDSGISINQCQNGVTEACYFQGHPDKGIYITGGPATTAGDDYGSHTVTLCTFYRCNTAASSTRQSGRFNAISNWVTECGLGFGRTQAGEGVAEVPPGREMIAIGNYITRTGSRCFRLYGYGGDVVMGNIVTDWGQDYIGASQSIQYAVDIRGCTAAQVRGNTFRFRDWTPDAAAAAVNLRSLVLETGTTQCSGNVIDGNVIQGVPNGIVEANSTVGTSGLNAFDTVTTPVTYATGSNSHLGLRKPDGTEQPFLSALAVGHSGPTDFTTAGFGVDATGVVRAIVDGATAVRLNRLTSLGTVLQIFDRGTSAGSIQTISTQTALAAVAAWFGALKPTARTTAELTASPPDIDPQLYMLVMCSDGDHGKPCLARGTGSAFVNAITGQALTATAGYRTDVVYSGTSTLDFGSIVAGGRSSLTVSSSGLLTTDIGFVNPTSGTVQPTGIDYRVRISADTINLTANNTSSGTIVVPSGNFAILVLRPSSI